MPKTIEDKVAEKDPDENIIVGKISAKARMMINRIMLALALLFTVTISTVAAASINLTPIKELLDAVVVLIPSFIDLVVAMAPLLVILAVVGFIIKFLDRILEFLKF
jgi:hypothetical protein